MLLVAGLSRFRLQECLEVALKFIVCVGVVVAHQLIHNGGFIGLNIIDGNGCRFIGQLYLSSGLRSLRRPGGHAQRQHQQRRQYQRRQLFCHMLHNDLLFSKFLYICI